MRASSNAMASGSNDRFQALGNHGCGMGTSRFPPTRPSGRPRARPAPGQSNGLGTERTAAFWVRSRPSCPLGSDRSNDSIISVTPHPVKRRRRSSQRRRRSRGDPGSCSMAGSAPKPGRSAPPALNRRICPISAIGRRRWRAIRSPAEHHDQWLGIAQFDPLSNKAASSCERAWLELR